MGCLFYEYSLGCSSTYAAVSCGFCMNLIAYLLVMQLYPEETILFQESVMKVSGMAEGGMCAVANGEFCCANCLALGGMMCMMLLASCSTHNMPETILHNAAASKPRLDRQQT